MIFIYTLQLVVGVMMFCLALFNLTYNRFSGEQMDGWVWLMHMVSLVFFSVLILKASVALLSHGTIK